MIAKPVLGVIIPAFNAERHIGSVIGRVPESAWDRICEVLIVNDGSTDHSRTVIDQIAAENPKIKPVHCTHNRGYGNAVKIGLTACRKDACDIVCCLHADGQYPPESIPEFIGYLQENGVDILQGSRIASGTALSGGMPLYKYVAGRILTFFENKVFKLRMTDYHSGFIFYSRRALETINFYALSNSFDFDLEVIAFACSNGLRVAELPIPARYADETSYLRPIRYGLRVVLVMVKYLFGVYRRQAWSS